MKPTVNCFTTKPGKNLKSKSKRAKTPVCNGWRVCTDDVTSERKFKMKTQTTKKAIINEYSNIIKVWNADVYVIDTDTVFVSVNVPFGNIILPRNVIDALNTCAESATQLLINNLDELAPGIEFDFDTFVFGGAIEVPEIKEKLKMSMNRSYGVNKHQV